MSDEWQMPEPIPPDPDDPRVQAALAELKERILEHYPTATFQVTTRDDDPPGVFLTAIVDVDDLDAVADLVLSRAVDMMLEDGLQIYVNAHWPLERVAVYLREQAQAQAQAQREAAAVAAQF